MLIRILQNGIEWIKNCNAFEESKDILNISCINACDIKHNNTWNHNPFRLTKAFILIKIFKNA